MVLFGFSILFDAEQAQINKRKLFMTESSPKYPSQEKIEPVCPNFCYAAYFVKVFLFVFFFLVKIWQCHTTVFCITTQESCMC